MSVRSRHLFLSCLVTGSLFASGCGRDQGHSSKPPMNDHEMHQAEQQSVETNEKVNALINAQEKLLSHMENRLKKLEKLLSERGKGAYRSGPSIGLTGSDDTLLQSLHEFEQTVSALRSEQRELVEQNKGLRQRLSEIDAINDRLRNQLTFLRDADGDAERLRQERIETLRLMTELKDHLTTAEVERLRSERRYYDLIREIITLKSDETSRFIALQSRLRGEITTLRPDDLRKNMTEGP